MTKRQRKAAEKAVRESSAKALVGQSGAQPEAGATDDRKTYRQKMAKLSPVEKVAFKVGSLVKRTQKIADRIVAWGVTSEHESADQVAVVSDALATAQTALDSTLDALNDLGDFKPPRSGGTRGRPAQLAPGAIVQIKEKFRAEYGELMPDVNLDALKVILSSGKSLKVKLSDGTTAFIARSKVKLADEDDGE